MFSPLKERIIAISLLFMLFVPVAAIFSYLHFEKAAIKRQIKWKMIAGMDQEELVLLKFSIEEIKTKLRWEHSKEFEYDGEMYDVVSKVIKGDSIYYRCWWDHTETALNKKLQKLVASAFDNDKDKQRNQKELNLYFKTFFCVEPLDWQTSATEVSARIYRDLIYSDNFSSLRISPPTPPPKRS